MPKTIEDVLKDWRYMGPHGPTAALSNGECADLAAHLKKHVVMLTTVERAVSLCPDMESQRTIMADLRALTTEPDDG